MGNDKNWADKLADIADRAVGAAQDAWDSTESARNAAWGSVKSSAEAVGGVATSAGAKAKESWRGSAPEDETPDDAETGDAPTESVDGIDSDVEQELKEAIEDSAEDESTS